MYGLAWAWSRRMFPFVPGSAEVSITRIAVRFCTTEAGVRFCRNRRASPRGGESREPTAGISNSPPAEPAVRKVNPTRRLLCANRVPRSLLRGVWSQRSVRSEDAGIIRRSSSGSRKMRARWKGSICCASTDAKRITAAARGCSGS